MDDKDFPPLPSRRLSNTLATNQDGLLIASNSCALENITITDLPAELLLHILSFLPSYTHDYERPKILRSLAKTSKRFHDLVTPEMYSRFDPIKCEPYLFLRTIVTNPNLACLTNEIYQSYHSFEPEKRYKPNAQDKRIIKEGLKKVNFPDSKRWATECNSENADLEMLCSIIFILAKNVSIFGITRRPDEIRQKYMTPAWLWLLKKMTFERDIKQKTMFANLREIELSAEEGFSLRQLACLFRISKLQKLTVYRLFDDGDDEERKAEALARLIPKNCNDLKSLRFQQCFVKTDLLGVVLQSARALEEFWYSVFLHDRWARLLEEDDFRPGYVEGLAEIKLADMLRCQRDSLKTIIVSMEWRSEKLLRGSLHFREGLRDFSTTTHVCCSLNMFIPDENPPECPLAAMLPPNIDGLSVSVSDYPRDAHRIAAFKELATKYEEYTPNLEFAWLEIKPSECEQYR